MNSTTAEVFAWVDGRMDDLSSWSATIWDFAEPALREYRSAAWYVDRLEREGFAVETGSGGMPTAFRAEWSNGGGPRILAYAEYDAVPGNCQAATTRKQPRQGLSPHAAGHTDPHSALGISALGGALAAKAVMARHGLKGTIVFFGEPAEKLRLSKPVHAAKGYYDDLDAAISFHPAYMLPLVNTVRLDTHCGAGYAAVYSFECAEPERWLTGEQSGPIPVSHVAARAPGATDALFHMFALTKQTQSNMLPFTQGWSISEAVLTAGQATADNLPAGLAEIQYFWRTPTIAMAEQVARVLDHNAQCAARAAHCSWRRTWVTKSRPGLANHVLAEATYRNIGLAGPPRFAGKAIRLAQALQAELGLEPMATPYSAVAENTISPQDAEAALRRDMPPTQLNMTSDDYTEYCWHCPTVRFYIGRPMLEAPPGFAYPAWAMNALGGMPPCIDPMIRTAAKVVGATIIDLIGDADLLGRAQQEWRERTGGGIGGSRWLAPLLPGDFRVPHDCRWPEYVTTARGTEWWIPTRSADRQ
jgi:aminobenzoyl-glutamate utilization protein B